MENDPNNIDHLDQDLRRYVQDIHVPFKARLGIAVLGVPGATGLIVEAADKGAGDIFLDIWAGSLVLGVAYFGGSVAKELWQGRNPELKHER